MFKRNGILTIFLMTIIAFAISCSNNEKQEVKKEIKKEVKQEVKKNEQEVVITPGSIGAKAADFKLVNLDGETVTLETYKDKVIMLNFWATWCPPCKKEIPDFIKMYDKYEKDGLVILGVGGFREGLDKIQPFVDEKKINYPVLIIEQKKVESLVNNYGGIRGIPTTFLIDKDGIIREKWVGPRSEEVFMKEVNKYLK